jgi:dolichol-phosphate mannosyltransferase
MIQPLHAANQRLAIDRASLAPRPGLSIIVPCHNEADSLARLAARLQALRTALGNRWEVELVLVDDGSNDATWKLLHDYFADEPRTRLIRHDTNRGIAAAIHTGMREASGEIVASLDADCTYDPLQLLALLRRMNDEIDLVVASPYHPAGKITGVALWRLALSRLASRFYRGVMRNKLYTYTSCVRVYRRSSVIDLPLTQPRFVGIVELVWQLDRRGGKIVECPAELTVRTTGQSKMRVARTALAHLRLLALAAWQRLCTQRPIPLRRNAVLITHQEMHLEHETAL